MKPLLLTMCAALALRAEVVEKSAKVAGVTLHYKVVLPKNYDAAKEYPAVLAFPGGPQTMETVDSSIQRNWRAEAEKRGYIVVVPSAPDGVLFFQGGERVFPEFLKKLLADYKIRDGKFHMAGVSNGGISAFHVAAMNPTYFRTITGYPGYLPDANDARIKAISGMCIYMHVGTLDTDWLGEMQQQAKMLRAKGLTVQLTEEKNQPHRIETLAGASAARLFDQFEAVKPGCGK